MNALSKSSVASLLAASFLGLAGSAQAVTVTMSANWDSSALTGVSTTGAATYTAAGMLAAASSQTWNTATDVGQSRTFTFNAPLTVSVDASVALSPPFYLDNYIGGTTATFSGVGAVTYALAQPAALLTHGISVENTGGSAAKITFTQQNTALFSSVLGADTLQWSVHYVAQPQVSQSFVSGFAVYNFPSVAMEVTLLSAVPETGTAAMLALGLVPLVLAKRRRQRD